MFRIELSYLKQWKASAIRKPVLLRGARQVGKSWLVREHGKEYTNIVEINFEENLQLENIFQNNINPEYLLKLIQNVLDVKIIQGETLLFIDEIQLCPRAIVALRYFYEKMPGLHVIAAGSLIEFELEKISIPVGRIEFLYLNPLSFMEFLIASEKINLVEEILNNTGKPLNGALHDLLCGLFRDYTLIGGMPEVAASFIGGRSLSDCQKIQSTIVETYKADFIKYAKKQNIPHLHLLLNALPLQIGKKLKYNNISSEIRSLQLAKGLELMEKAGLITKIYHSDCNGSPLAAEVNLKKFKFIFLDVGLTNNLLGVDLKSFYLNDDIKLINNGAIAEAVAGQELLAYTKRYKKQELFYWHREDKISNAELDYVIEIDSNIIPIEVKDGKTGKLRSLHSFMERKNPSMAIKISKENYSSHNRILSIPFYGIMALYRDNIMPLLPLN